MNFNKLDQDCRDFLNYIGDISKDRKVRWIEGNHDKGLSEMFSALLGATVYESYSWQYKQEKYLVIHGHQFDRFLINNVFISFAATKFYEFVQRIDFEDKRISHYLKKRSKGWLRLSEKVYHSAISYAKKNGASYIFCGHTHKALEKTRNGIKYYNSGCWTDIPCSYITIDENKVVVHEY